MQPRMLVLKRPLVSFDLETTGLDVNSDRIVEISCVRVDSDGSRQVRTRRINPGRPIPAAATEVHGIRDEDVANEPTFAQIARSLHRLLSDCDLTGFNVERFDLPMLQREFQRVGIDFPDTEVRVIDSHSLFSRKEPRDLTHAYRFYCDKALMHAHTAEADAVAALEILQAQVERYEDLPCEIQALQDYLKPSSTRPQRS